MDSCESIRFWNQATTNDALELLHMRRSRHIP
jgi:hypothetical protein